jgi:glycosyltransferase involved in cell wall biosynthesis
MSPPIVYDVLRLFLGASSHTPRGIDRVDLGYAHYLFDHWRGDCLGLMLTPWGLRLYERRRVLRGLDRLEALWGESGEAHGDPVLTQVLRQLEGAEPGPRPRRGRSSLSAGVRQWNMLAATGIAPGVPAARTAPTACLYLNVGQLGWAASWMVRWLRHRPDVRPVFMLHDVIPIEHPHLVSRLGHITHKRMIDAAARHAAGLIFTTASAADSVLAELRARGRSAPPAVALPLPVAPVFLHREPPDPRLAAHGYFVLYGAIEPRKNHLMLLQAWDELVQQMGERAPVLVVAGWPARGSKPILERLYGCGSLRRHVIVASGLSSPALCRLIAHARAVLMPSLAEGFGLPIVEALTLGTPVVASDLPAHLEAGGHHPTYVDPNDRAGWVREIARHAEDHAHVAALRERIAGYRPMTAEDYFAGVAKFLEGFG